MVENILLASPQFPPPLMANLQAPRFGAVVGESHAAQKEGGVERTSETALHVAPAYLWMSMATCDPFSFYEQFSFTLSRASHLSGLKTRQSKVPASLVKFPCVTIPGLWPEYRLRRAIAEFSRRVTTSDPSRLMQPVATLAPRVECIFLLLEPEAER